MNSNANSNPSDFPIQWHTLRYVVVFVYLPDDVDIISTLIIVNIYYALFGIPKPY